MSLKNINVNKKQIICIVLVFMIGFFAGQLANLNSKPPTVIEAAKIHGHVVVKVWDAEGNLIYEYEQHNIIVTIGSKYIRNILGFNNITNMNATISISLSNDTAPSTSWTKLPNEYTTLGLDRAEGTASVVNATAYQVQHTWTATGEANVSCTGLHWSPVDGSDNNLFAAAEFAQVTLQVDYQIQVTWTVNTPSG